MGLKRAACLADDRQAALPVTSEAVLPLRVMLNHYTNRDRLMNACTEVINVEDQVRTIVGLALSIDASGVPLHSRLVIDLGMDSLAAMEIFHGLEDTFSFTIDGLRPPPIEVLRDLVNLAQLHAR